MPAIAIPRPAVVPPPYYTRCMYCGALAARRCETGECRHCDTCEAVFLPCDDYCPGFMVNCAADAGANPIEICDECSASAKHEIAVHGGAKKRRVVDDLDARGWPEAYLAVAAALRAGEWEIDREDDE